MKRNIHKNYVKLYQGKDSDQQQHNADRGVEKEE